jgi:hypothetical protein
MATIPIVSLTTDLVGRLARRLPGSPCRKPMEEAAQRPGIFVVAQLASRPLLATSRYCELTAVKTYTKIYWLAQGHLLTREWTAWDGAWSYRSFAGFR